ncbi:MAG: UDP-N-acetylmuramoyl-L-alanyl-D-glutamate--2,6-diaminopimelate ligase [Gemmatimonadota bacterium]|nr:UDP-N-acetylmuramoyl-L-alanyl-D-glutamate--2,6-diaminopimelate ligase [Gemmatimonadota bacterium]
MSDPRTVATVGDVLRSADLLTQELGAGDVAVRGVAQDSRLVRAGDLFVAWKGTAVDAHDFVADAASRGAVAAVVEYAVDVDIPQLVVRDGRRAAALAADCVVGSPGDEMLMIGVTGTNGKTTTAHLVRHLLAPDIETAVIGTLGLVEDGCVRPGTEGLTTPGPVQVAVWLRELADGGTRAVVLEASSHALAQARLDGIRFEIAVFTNLTQDHLDYHLDIDGYFAAKAHLLELVTPDGAVVVNADEAAWSALDVGGRRVRTFSVEGDADFLATSLRLGAGGTEFTLEVDGESRLVRTPLVGRYNVENTLAAMATAQAAGIDLTRIIERLETVPPVAGRLETVASDPFTVLIDFAHTPAALENALAAVKPLTKGRLIVVFGAGGDRDRTKRAPMAEAASRWADLVVLTSDNPRTEDPDAIIDEVEVGLGPVEHLRYTDRKAAIHAALEAARPGDTVLLAGKGHESYQVIGTEKRPFDEAAIVHETLRGLGAA